MMTDAQKKMIAKMRGLGAGYTEVAKQLDLPVGTIKTYCRRNGLTGDRRDTQLKKKSKNTRENDLIDRQRICCGVAGLQLGLRKDAGKEAALDTLVPRMRSTTTIPPTA